MLGEELLSTVTGGESFRPSDKYSSLRETLDHVMDSLQEDPFLPLRGEQDKLPLVAIYIGRMRSECDRDDLAAVKATAADLFEVLNTIVGTGGYIRMIEYELNKLG